MLVTFYGGRNGQWKTRDIITVCGPPIESVERLAVQISEPPPDNSTWILRGAVSNARYTTRAEAGALTAAQPPLGRPLATFAALIPIRKTAQWWSLAQDERRAIFETISRHTTIGMEYLPRIARRLHHCRDLGEPFDFLTWFEYAPVDEPAFDELLRRLRASDEWSYVDREIDIRLVRDDQDL